DYPAAADEMEVLRRWESGIELRDPVKAGVEPVLGPADIQACRDEVAKVVVDEKIRRYVVDLAAATRSAPEITLGASTRAEVLLMLAARAYAAFEGAEFVTPDHVKALLAAAFRHRLILRPEAEVAGRRQTACSTLSPDGWCRRAEPDPGAGPSAQADLGGRHRRRAHRARRRVTFPRSGCGRLPRRAGDHRGA